VKTMNSLITSSAATTRTTVRHLVVGQVFSVPGTGGDPVLIEAISTPLVDVRFIYCIDPTDGSPRESRYVLGLQREVDVYEVDARHHHYTNISETTLEVRFGRRDEEVEPGETLHYTGVERPDVFDAAQWSHRIEASVTERERTPL
jgi:hypothetical protein